MNIVEMQPAALSTSFPVSDTSPSHASSYLDHAKQPHYAESLQPSKENKTPPPVEDRSRYSTSPRLLREQQASPNGLAHINPHLSPQSSIAGKKRSANGQVKEDVGIVKEDMAPATEASKLTFTGHSRNTSTVSTGSNAAMLELSQQLRTRLTYAMIKVQNGWQNRSLDEVESIASQSPRSTTFNHYSNQRNILSPRAAITAQLQRQNSHSSTDSAQSEPAQPQSKPTTTLMSPPASRKALAPPAKIVARPSSQRRRPTPNNISVKPLSPARPAIAQRTPSQNAAMEADAVETLLFMASPNNSGGHQSQHFSPVTSAPSIYPSQRSPLRNTFSAPVSPKRVAFATETGYAARYTRDKHAVIASLVEKLDGEDDADLDEALKLMDRHYAAKAAS